MSDRTYYCPSCGHQTMENTAKVAFVEIGEWDGKHYEEELDAFVCKCGSCGFEVYMPDVGQMAD